MQWLSLVAVLACPIMMIFFMRGMMGGHKHNSGGKSSQGYNPEEFQKLQAQVQELTEQNEALRKQIQSEKNVS